MKLLALLPSVFVLALPVAVLAAPPDPCTSLSNVVDRPTVTNAACAVEPNHILLETGYSNLSSIDGAGNNVTFPQAQLRVGTDIRHLEVDVLGPNENRVAGRNGLGDSGGGLKYLLGYSPRMQYGVQLAVTEPTGSASFSAGAAQTTSTVNASLSLSPVFSLNSTQDFSSLVAAGRHYSQYVPTLVVAASLPNALTAFGEIAIATNALGPQTSSRTQYLFGTSYDVTPKMQLDVEEITSPTKATGRYSGIGLGLSYMLH